MARTDGHYCLIKYLAYKANLPAWEGELLAYASELVDHATDHTEIYVEGVPERFGRLLKRGCLSQVCTAHSGIEYVNFLLNKEALEKVLLSFHFLPSKFYRGKGFDYVTKIQSDLFDSMLSTVLMQIKEVEGLDEHALALIRLGILLHTLLDMYTHSGFSGRHHKENDVENLMVEGEYGDQEVGIIPDIGHGELMNYPDLSYAIFTYQNYRGEKVCRNNPELFMQAAQRIFDILCDITLSKPLSFFSFEGELRECFSLPSSDLEEVIAFWQKKFPILNFDFKPKAWKQQAIESIPINETIMARYGVSEACRYRGNQSSKLLLFFYEAALDQREFVLNHIKRL